MGACARLLSAQTCSLIPVSPPPERVPRTGTTMMEVLMPVTRQKTQRRVDQTAQRRWRALWPDL